MGREEMSIQKVAKSLVKDFSANKKLAFECAKKAFKIMMKTTKEKRKINR